MYECHTLSIWLSYTEYMTVIRWVYDSHTLSIWLSYVEYMTTICRVLIWMLPAEINRNDYHILSIWMSYAEYMTIVCRVYDCLVNECHPLRLIEKSEVPIFSSWYRLTRIEARKRVISGWMERKRIEEKRKSKRLLGAKADEMRK